MSLLPPASRRPAAQPPVHWGAEALWERVEPVLPGLSIEIVERLASTNTELVERLRRAARTAVDHDGRSRRNDDLLPQLLVANSQTAGRGRLGRRWHATPGASLTFSLSLPLARADWSGLSLAVGLAIAEALDAGGKRIGLKWPNDLMRCEPGPGLGRKLGGILIESVSVGTQRFAVIGIGLNVRPQRVPDPDLRLATVSELDDEASAPGVLTQLMPQLADALVLFDQQGFAPFVQGFARRDVLRGRQLRTTDPAMPEGLAAGVDEDGALQITQGGQSYRLISGEVSVRPLPPA